MDRKAAIQSKGMYIQKNTVYPTYTTSVKKATFPRVPALSIRREEAAAAEEAAFGDLVALGRIPCPAEPEGESAPGFAELRMGRSKKQRRRDQGAALRRIVTFDEASRR